MSLHLCLDCAVIYLCNTADSDPKCPQCGQSLRLTPRDGLELTVGEESEEKLEPAWRIG